MKNKIIDILSENIVQHSTIQFLEMQEKIIMWRIPIT